ncbi:MAG: hypothetical protein WCX64_04245 [Candidatus Micrarchaeia archaeon]
MGLVEGITGFLSKVLNFIIAAVRTSLLLSLGLLLMVSVLLAILANSARFTLLDPNFYLNNLDSANAYDSVKTVALEFVATSITGQYPDSPQKEKVISEFRSGLENAVPTAWFRNSTRKILTNTFAYAKGETYQLDLKVSIAEIKPGLKAAFKDVLPKLANLTQASSAAYPAGQFDVGAATDTRMPSIEWPGNCNSVEGCMAFCEDHRGECSIFDDTPYDLRMNWTFLKSKCGGTDGCVPYCRDLVGTSLNPNAGGVEGNCSRMLQFIDATAPGQPVPQSVLQKQPTATPSPSAAPSTSSAPSGVPQYELTGPGGCRNKTGCLQYCALHQDECADANYTITVAANMTILGAFCSTPQACIEYCRGDISNDTGEVKDECGRVNADYSAAQADLLGAVAGQQSEQASSEAMGQMIEQQIDALPDVIDLDEQMQHQLSTGLGQVRPTLGTAMLACNLLIGVAIAFALLISLVAFRVRGATRHVGWPLFLAGLIATLLALIAPKIILDTVAQGVVGGEFAQAAGVLMDVAARIVWGYFNTVLIPGIIVCLIGAGMVIYSFKMKDKGQDKAEKEDSKEEPEEESEDEGEADEAAKREKKPGKKAKPKG